MTNNRYWFESFKEWNDTVMMGDDGMHRMKGSGTMQIKKHDGMGWKLDCWFVPDL